MCDWFLDLSRIKKLGLVMAGVVVLILIILLSISTTLLEPLKYGLEYDGNAIQVDKSKIYQSGRHFNGPGMGFIEFPKD